MTSDTASGRSISAAPDAYSAPVMPPTDHMPWKLAMMLRPYAFCTRTPCMFMPGIDAADAETVEDERGEQQSEVRRQPDQQGTETDRRQCQLERRSTRTALGDHAGDHRADTRHHGDHHEDPGQPAVADVELVLDARRLRHDRREHQALQEEACGDGDPSTCQCVSHRAIVGGCRV